MFNDVRMIVVRGRQTSLRQEIALLLEKGAIGVALFKPTRRVLVRRIAENNLSVLLCCLLSGVLWALQRKWDLPFQLRGRGDRRALFTRLLTFLRLVLQPAGASQVLPLTSATPVPAVTARHGTI